MCKPELAQPVRNVVVAGAGPAGLLLSSLLLKRNQTQGNIRYQVTLIDAGQDYGKLDHNELKRYRSWMIGLSGHGLTALRTIPSLYEDYVSKIGVRLKSASIHIGAKEINSDVGEEGESTESYIVDRNFICAAIARYLNDFHAIDQCFVSAYGTKILFVDGDNHRVLVRGTDGSNERYINYDLLIGCDGLRSRVREAILQRHRDFECDIGDIFQDFKSVHIERPTSVESSSMHLLPLCLPFGLGIALPETGNMINMSIGVARNNFFKLDEELKSDDPSVVAKYMKEHFKAFELVDYDDFGKQWVSQRWNRTGQVHCNFYHSLELSIAIMGDAAHATSPALGMGMNTALKDAAAFVRLLNEHEDDIKMVLPAFSKERVKEGNSLTDLSMHLNCFDIRAQMMETLHTVVRSKLSKVFPWFVAKHAQELVGLPDVELSYVYSEAMRQGIIPKHRYLNEKTRREYFETECGMAKPISGHAGIMKSVTAAALVMAMMVGVFHARSP